MVTYLGNAFSLQMLDVSVAHTLVVTPVTIEEVVAADFVSVVGHADTANVLTSMLGREVAMNRTSVKLDTDTVLYVAQIVGGRLPEGATTLPEGFQLSFLKVTLA